MELFNVYSLYPVEPVRGQGSYVYDREGREYLDLYGGHAVISIGHAHPHYVKMISEQVARLGFYSNSVENSLQQQLADRLGQLSGYDDYQLFLCNSGAEANENALKLASFATEREQVLCFKKAFHGRTSGAVAATDNPKINAPFNRTDKVEFVPLNDVEESPLKPSYPDTVRAFQQSLEAQGIPTTVRRTLGSDINASCGQLRRKYEKGREETQCKHPKLFRSTYGRSSSRWLIW